jgi:dTDP-4-dehydrorhamnose 3,5-epimerase
MSQKSAHRRVGGDAIELLNVRGDERGRLVAVEQLRDVPFNIRRVYYIYGTSAEVGRGFHAHRSLHQFGICVSGSCRMVLDDGETRHDIRMEGPQQGLHIDPMVWHEMYDFSPDCVLLVLADAPYDEDDYIRDYAEFRRLSESPWQ